MKKFLIIALLASLAVACGKNTKKADMYEASPLASMMRDMVDFSKEARTKLQNGEKVEVPQKFFDLKEQKGTRDEHEDEVFQQMADVYLATLKDMEQKHSQLYYYNQSIKACQNCHSTYCGGPLVVIDQLPLELND